MTQTGPETAVGEQPIAKDIPRNLVFFIGAMVAIGALSLDAYLPAMPAMAADFNVGIVELNNTISVYLIGFGLGQFFGGALSDQIGRKRIGLIGLSTFTLASLAIAFAHTVEQVQWLRFVQAIGGGFSTVICMAIVRDVFPVEQLGRRMAMVTMIMLASPLVAPSVGAFLLTFGWPTIFVAKAVYSSVLFAYYLLVVPETQPGSWQHLSLGTIFRQCGEVLRRRVDGVRLPIRLALTMALGAGVFMTYLTNSSFAFIQYFGVSESVFPVFFGLNVLGMLLANLFCMRRLTPRNARSVFRFGLGTQLAAVCTLVALVLFGAATLWTVMPPLAIMVTTLGLIGPSGSSQYMSCFSKLAGSASSVYTTLLFTTGATLGAISGYFFDGTLAPMALTMLGASLLSNGIAMTLPRRRSA